MKPADLTFAVEARLRFIDFLLVQYGCLRRSAVTDYFGVSTVQASADFKAYLTISPKNMHYDAHAKAYVRGDEFARVWR